MSKSGKCKMREFSAWAAFPGEQHKPLDPYAIAAAVLRKMIISKCNLACILARLVAIRFDRGPVAGVDLG